MSSEKTSVDWENVRRELDKAAAALQGSIEIPPERAAEILESRARELARTPGQQSDRPRLRLLMFRIGAEEYAIEASHVRGVAKIAELTPLPTAPRHVVGIIHTRGETLPLFDIRLLFSNDNPPLTDLSYAIVIGDPVEFALVADQASAIADVPLDEISAPPPSMSALDQEIVRGITRGTATILDADALCRDRRLFVQGRSTPDA